jgi:hypothetical protein
MDENYMFGDPARVHNADESGLQLNNRPQKIVSMKGKKNVMSVTAKEKGEIGTVVACVSATGVFMTPYVIFKGKNLGQEFRDGMPPGAAVSMSKLRYITVEIFHDFIKYFVSLKPQGNKQNILLLDGHSTQESDPDTLQYILDNNVIMKSILLHTSHYIQPLDRSFFRSLKVYCYSARNNWIKKNPVRGITKF